MFQRQKYTLKKRYNFNSRIPKSRTMINSIQIKVHFSKYVSETKIHIKKKTQGSLDYVRKLRIQDIFTELILDGICLGGVGIKSYS